MKGNWLWYGGFALAGVAGYLWWQNRQSSTAITNPEVVDPTAAASGSGATVPSGPGYPYYTGLGTLSSSLSGQQTATGSDPSGTSGTPIVSPVGPIQAG